MKTQPFTRQLEEESPGYAKLKSRKYRKIRFNEEEQAIMEGDEHAAIAGVSIYMENNPDDEEAYGRVFDEIKTQRHVETLNKQDFEVFYSFSNATRGKTGYGNANWSARFLYEFLSSGFNGGERFVDTYLNRVFPYRPVYLALKELVQYIQNAIETKWNDGELKGGQWTAFYRFQSEQMSYLRNSLERFSREIRQDIIQCLSIGLIPLNFSLSPETLKKRQALGLGNSPFYATSWLINQIQVHVILGDENTGQMYYSDTYKGAN
jgi:hypothetical protein